MEKECNKCFINKELSEYHKDIKTKDGYRSTCKKCRKTNYKGYDKNYYDMNKEKIKENTKNYRKNNILKNKEIEKQYYIENINKIKKYYIKNKERIIKIKQIYVENNKEKIRVNSNKYFVNRFKNDNLFKLSVVTRNRIRQSLKTNGVNKNSKTIEILGCSFEEFKLYLESNFESWMNWDNHGLYNGNLNYGWDLDHTIPISSAKTEEELLKLNHFSNLKPLCSKINRDIKRDNIK